LRAIIKSSPLPRKRRAVRGNLAAVERREIATNLVLAGLDPATHALGRSKEKDVDARIKSAQDDFKSFFSRTAPRLRGQDESKGGLKP